MSLSTFRPSFMACLVCLLFLALSHAVSVQNLYGQPVVTEESEKAKEKETDDPAVDQKDKKPKSEFRKESPEERRRRIRERAQNSMGSVTNLVGIPQIQKELDLSDDQRKQIADQVKSMQLYLRQQFTDVRKLPRAEQSAKIRELKVATSPFVNEQQAKILEVLTPSQRNRLTGISMQYRGVESLLDDQIADLLGLTKEQREEILMITEDLDITLATERQKMVSQQFEERQKGRNEFLKKMQRLRKQAEEKMLAVLTEEQRERFELLQGEKFRVRRPKGPTLIQSPETDSAPVPLKKLD
ncbi:hypothetical protein OAE80_00890 [Planctomycetaceae bacterium]|jgi:hypothetical protein|nr:hypothetical protein [Planctomycetaceae bacterium]